MIITNDFRFPVEYEGIDWGMTLLLNSPKLLLIVVVGLLIFKFKKKTLLKKQVWLCILALFLVLFSVIEYYLLYGSIKSFWDILWINIPKYGAW